MTNPSTLTKKGTNMTVRLNLIPIEREGMMTKQTHKTAAASRGQQGQGIRSSVSSPVAPQRTGSWLEKGFFDPAKLAYLAMSSWANEPTQLACKALLVEVLSKRIPMPSIDMFCGNGVFP